MIRLKRAYEPATRDDGVRILVERLWPRGLSKQRAAIDLWLKDAAPSAELRQWFAHDPRKWPEFRKRYRDELKRRDEALAVIRRAIGRRRTTFVYAAADRRHNSAIVLKDFLERRRPGR